MALNCQLAATSWGSPEAPTVLLAHGWNSRRSHWSAFVPELRDSGFRVVAVDAPAHGDSPGDRANVLAYGKALRAVGEELGPLAGIVGHSFGAGAAVIALHHGLAADRAVLRANWGIDQLKPGVDAPPRVQGGRQQGGLLHR